MVLKNFSTVIVETHVVLLSLNLAVATHSVDFTVFTELGRLLTLGENVVDRLGL